MIVRFTKWIYLLSAPLWNNILVHSLSDLFGTKLRHVGTSLGARRESDFLVELSRNWFTVFNIATFNLRTVCSHLQVDIFGFSVCRHCDWGDDFGRRSDLALGELARLVSEDQPDAVVSVFVVTSASSNRGHE